jgi:2-oxoglutarate ferredoxin oxidoreductase subunit beta
VAVNSQLTLKKRKKPQEAFEHQLNKTGFSIVEFLSPCPTNWRMGTIESCKWIDDVMTKNFPLGVFKEAKCK